MAIFPAPASNSQRGRECLGASPRREPSSSLTANASCCLHRVLAVLDLLVFKMAAIIGQYLTPPMPNVTPDYDGLEYRWKFLTFRPACKCASLEGALLVLTVLPL